MAAPHLAFSAARLSTAAWRFAPPTAFGVEPALRPAPSNSAMRKATGSTRAISAASGESSAPTGELIVTATIGLGRIYLIPILADFLKAYPDITVRLILTDSVLSLFEEQIDVGLRIGALPDSSMMAIRVGAIRRMVCASPAYLAARGTPRTPDDLAGHDCISYAAFGSPDAWTFVRDKTDVAVPVHARLVVGSAEAAIDAACAGIGITWAFSYHFKPALERGALTTLLDEFQPEVRQGGRQVGRERDAAIRKGNLEVR